MFTNEMTRMSMTYRDVPRGNEGIEVDCDLITYAKRLLRAGEIPANSPLGLLALISSERYEDRKRGLFYICGDKVYDTKVGKFLHSEGAEKVFDERKHYADQVEIAHKMLCLMVEINRGIL